MRAVRTLDSQIKANQKEGPIKFLGASGRFRLPPVSTTCSDFLMNLRTADFNVDNRTI